MEEKMRILKMVEDGSITASEAAELMNAMGVETNSPLSVKKTGYDKKMFRIIVDAPGGDKVNVQFPISAIKKILKVSGKLPIPEEALQGFDLASMMDAVGECLDEEMQGDFVNVSAADGTTVRIYVDK